MQQLVWLGQCLGKKKVWMTEILSRESYILSTCHSNLYWFKTKAKRYFILISGKSGAAIPNKSFSYQDTPATALSFGMHFKIW